MVNLFTSRTLHTSTRLSMSLLIPHLQQVVLRPGHHHRPIWREHATLHTIPMPRKQGDFFFLVLGVTHLQRIVPRSEHLHRPIWREHTAIHMIIMPRTVAKSPPPSSNRPTPLTCCPQIQTLTPSHLARIRCSSRKYFNQRTTTSTLALGSQRKGSHGDESSARPCLFQHC